MYTQFRFALLVSTITSFSLSALEESGYCETKSRSSLKSLLDCKINTSCSMESHEVDELIRFRFERRLAIMITDLSGMTAATRQYGIIDTLARIEYMHHIAVPLAQSYGVFLVKFFSDDMLFAHANPATLFSFAQALVASLRDVRVGRPIHVGVGISYGPVLFIEGKDAWGEAVNTASRLGEDIAGAGEILVDYSVWSRLIGKKVNLAGCKRADRHLSEDISHFVCDQFNEGTDRELIKELY